MTEVANLEVHIGAVITDLTRGLETANKNISSFAVGADSVLTQIGGKAQSFGDTLGASAAPFIGVVNDAISAASGFEDVMSQLSVMGGLAGDELETVSDLALQLGADTKFSASDAASGMLELVKSGQSVEEAMATIGATLDMAAVGNLDLATSAGIVSTALAQFGLDADSASMVTNTLAAAAVASKSDVDTLAEGLKNVGPVAASTGLSLNQTTAALATLSNAGIEGAEAGTQLKSLLLNLNSTTAKQQLDALGVSMYDAAGNTRDFDTVLDEIDVALSKMTPEQQATAMKNLAGSYGITALSALLAADGIDGMQDAMTKVPSAATLAQAASQTFSGKMDGLKGSIESVYIRGITPLLGALGDLIDKVVPVVNSIGEWAEKHPQLITAVSGGLLALGGLATVLGAIGTVATLAGTGLTAIGTAIGIILTPLGSVVLGIGALAVLLTNPDVQNALKTWPENFRMLGEILSTVVAAGVETAKSKLDDLAAGVRSFVRDIEQQLLTVQMNAAKVQIALGINVEGNEQFVEDANEKLQLIDIAKKLESDLNSSIAAGGSIKLDIPQIEWLASDEAAGIIGSSGIEALAAQIADPTAIQEALNTSIGQGDTGAIKALLPLSLELADDPRVQMQDLLRTALEAGGENSAAFEALVPMATTLNIAVNDLVTQFEEAAKAAAAAKVIPVNVGVNVTLVPSSVTMSGLSVGGQGNVGAATGGGFIPAFASGGYMTHEGLAYLHAGERVLNPQETRAYERGGAPTGKGGHTFNISVMGQSPYELAGLLKKAIAEAGI